MIVMKFGGSSLADAAQIEKVFQIVNARRAQDPMVVCSAHKGITDMLIAAARTAASTGKPDATPLVQKERSILEALGSPLSLCDGLFSEMTDLLRGIALVREVSPRVLDIVQSFGERMSVRAVADYFTRRGLPSEAFDAFDLGFITDDKFGVARPLPEADAMMKAAFGEKVKPGVTAIVTGFIGKTRSGEVTTVGRNGSDYSASCFAAGLDASECQIWTDTDGVMTADPSVANGARSIPAMSFAEASELAYYGGRVLHPSTLVPAVKRNIPVRVLNTNRPDHPGTVITERGAEADEPVTSIAYKKRQLVVTVESPLMLGQSGFLAKIFDVVGRAGMDIDMISTSEVSVSMTCSSTGGLNAAVVELERLGKVTVTEGKSVLCVVGRSVELGRGMAAKVFSALEQAGVRVEMISKGINRINLSCLIDDSDVDRAVPALHRALFG